MNNNFDMVKYKVKSISKFKFIKISKTYNSMNSYVNVSKLIILF